MLILIVLPPAVFLCWAIVFPGLSYLQINRAYASVVDRKNSQPPLSLHALSNEFDLEVSVYKAGDVGKGWGLDDEVRPVFKARLNNWYPEDYFCVVVEDGVIVSIVPTFE